MTSIQYATFEYTLQMPLLLCVTRQLKNHTPGLVCTMRLDFCFVDEEKRWHTTTRGIILKKRPFDPYSDNDLKTRLDFISLAPVVCEWDPSLRIPYYFRIPWDGIVQSCVSPHLLSVQVFGWLSQALVAFGCLPTSSGAVQFDSRIEEWERRTRCGTATSGSNTRVSIHYSQSRLEREREERTQFIPGALPPKLKLLGTTGAVNLYPPCFSIIFDSRRNRKQIKLLL